MTDTSRRQKKKKKVQHEEEFDTSDHNFLFPNEIGAYLNNFYQYLVLERLFKQSFATLYRKSQQIGWMKILVDERQQCRTDRKQKSKRLILNRFISELNENPQQFNEQIEAIQRRINDLMSIDNERERANLHHLTNISDVFDQINLWREIQIKRRLFYTERGSLTNLILIQRRLTDYFLELVDVLYRGTDVSLQLHQLFLHALIFVDHPAGSDGIGATKYEKSPKEYLTKIKTRMICLLDPDRIRTYLTFSDAKVILFPYKKDIDPQGDFQGISAWKTRAIQSSEGQSATFLYIELKESDILSNSFKFNVIRREKLLYNTELCKLTFVTDFQIVGTNFSRTLTISSQPFGLCCRANYFPRYLAKIFLERIKPHFDNISLEKNNVVLEEKIFQFFRRLIGFSPHQYTKALIRENLTECFDNFLRMSSNSNNTSTSLSIFIYEDVLAKIFNQMKFLDAFPILGLLYSERIFVGLANDQIDEALRGNIAQPELLFRFESCPSTEYPNILFVVSNGIIRRSKFNSNDVMEGITNCVREAGENRTNSSLIWTENERIPFLILNKFYDEQMKQINEESTSFYPLKPLLQDTMRPGCSTLNLSSSRQEEHARHFAILGTLFTSRNTIDDAFQSIQTAFSHWCETENCRGTLKLLSFPESNREQDETYPPVTSCRSHE